MMNTLHKAILLVLLPVLIIPACVSRERDARPDEIVIRGMYLNAESAPIMLESMGPNGLVPMDTVTADEQGRFYFRNSVSEIGTYRIRNQMNSFLTLILSPGETAEVSADALNVERTYEVSGSRESGLLLEFEYLKRKAYDSLDSLQVIWDSIKYEAYADSMIPYLDSVSASITTGLRTGMEEFIITNKGSLASLFAVYQRFAGREVFNIEEDFHWFELVAEGLYESMPENLHTRDFRERIDNIRNDLERRGLLPGTGGDSLQAEQPGS